jgi:hypothetical protein
MRREYYAIVKYSLLAPLYWALMSAAAWKGFLQLFHKPSYWEKTIHGLHQEVIDVRSMVGINNARLKRTEATAA